MRRFGLPTLTVFLLAASTPSALAAQGHAANGGPGASPYVEHQVTSVRGLSVDEIHALRTGEGMGLARAAELNGYPGPRHVLDLADALVLTAEQRAAVQALFVRMQAEAVATGEELLTRHAALETAFRQGGVTPEELHRQTAAIGQLEGELRAIHLGYHLLTRALLSLHQLATYDRLRGYTDTPAPAHTGH
jgi:hypothetical protein